MSPLSIFGRDPPERAMVNLPFLSRASFCAFMTKAEMPPTRSDMLSKTLRTGVFGGWWTAMLREEREERETDRD